MKNRKIALLIDIDNIKIGKEAFTELYDKLNIIGNVVYCKFYGYNDRKHLYLTDVIAKYGYETASFMRFKKRFSQLDNRMLVDAVKLNYTKPEIDTYCIVAGDGDLIPLLVELKSCGKYLIDINTPYQETNTHMFDEHIKIYDMDSEVETYQPKTKKVVLQKPVIKKRPVKPVYEEEEEALVMRKPVSSPRPAVKIVEPEEDDEVPFSNDEMNDENYNFMDSDLQTKLNDITARTGELDFSNSKDMSKKLRLISDIETLIDDETDKGEGLDSENADIKQIFVELKELVEDMKSAL